ncbi:MAG: hypothetical protein QOJ60_894 [Actinomycetota bacterium]|nr:hypothetical protein [Actinomycetota bacterium]
MTDLSVWTEDDKPTGPRRRRRRERRGLLAVLIALLVVLALVGGAAAAVFGVSSRLTGLFHGPAPDYAGPGTGHVQVQVKSGQTVADIARTLRSEDVIKSVDAFLSVANAEPASSTIQPGFYDLQRKMAAADALTALLDPSARIQTRVTLPEGLRLDETVKLIAQRAHLPLRDLEQALKHPQALGLPAYAKGNPEGYLFPATYDVQPDQKAPDVLKLLFAAYSTAADKAGVTRTNRTPEEIVTIASLVEAEARRPGDFGKVARVVYDRLAKGMPLQLDSTVNYALKADKQIVTIADLGVDSPYNTYKNAGLPPGPIDSPGLAALRAAVNPTPGDWLYFVTTDPQKGTTKFTSSYQEFLRFKSELQSNQ